VIAEIFVMKGVTFRNINLIPLSVSRLDSFLLIKVILYRFLRNMLGTIEYVIKDRFPFNPG
jgi:hypothetical protein